jgi:hypothetical protein
MSEKAFRRHLEQGPDALTMDETKAALEWRDANPAGAHRVRERLNTERLEAAQREDARAEWLRQGGDAKDFDSVYGELSAERKKEALRQMDEAAREATARAFTMGL